MLRRAAFLNARSGMSTSSELHRGLLFVLAVLVVNLAAVAQSIARSKLPIELASLSDEELTRLAKMERVAAIPADPTNRVADDEGAANLGHRLFFDRRFSPKGVSCATCHDPTKSFTDGLPLAQGIGVAQRNTPSVLDAARRRWIGWDGKFDSLWSQALSPLENPLEMGSDRTTVLRVLRDDPELRAMYTQTFGAFPSELEAGPRDPLAVGAARDTATQVLVDATTANILKSLGAYQRRLNSGRAPIDRFVAALRDSAPGGTPSDASSDLAQDTVRGVDALSPSARRGLALFVGRAGCYQCHRGPEFSDEEFHSLGLTGANGRVPEDPARLAAVDFLKASPWNAAGAFSDDPASPKAQMVRSIKRSGELFGQFRTPSLRGVAATAPYMHDGRFARLDDVIHFYDTLDGTAPVGHHGESVLEPLGLDAKERTELVEFLKAISGAPANPKWIRDPKLEPLRTNGTDER